MGWGVGAPSGLILLAAGVGFGLHAALGVLSQHRWARITNAVVSLVATCVGLTAAVISWVAGFPERWALLILGILCLTLLPWKVFLLAREVRKRPGQDLPTRNDPGR